MQFPQLLLRHRRWRAHQQILRVLRHRERNHLADVRLAGKEHHDAIDAGSEAAVRRGAVAEGRQHAAKALLHFFWSVTRELERPQHHVWTMVTDRAARELDTIADDVVLEGLERQWVASVERV